MDREKCAAVLRKKVADFRPRRLLQQRQARPPAAATPADVDLTNDASRCPASRRVEVAEALRCIVVEVGLRADRYRRGSQEGGGAGVWPPPPWRLSELEECRHHQRRGCLYGGGCRFAHVGAAAAAAAGIEAAAGGSDWLSPGAMGAPMVTDTSRPRRKRANQANRECVEGLRRPGVREPPRCFRTPTLFPRSPG